MVIVLIITLIAIFGYFIIDLYEFSINYSTLNGYSFKWLFKRYMSTFNKFEIVNILWMILFLIYLLIWTINKYNYV
jgi:hypothetical protein